MKFRKVSYGHSVLETISSVPPRENPKIKNVRNIKMGIYQYILELKKTVQNFLENQDRQVHLIVLTIVSVLNENIELK